ncbi:MAG TPA: hypothetical protein PK228_08160, partial [Saprospiraceae bacterium]|nr:hypothetical protein [Saprospiraceae bacterium]
MCKDTILLPFKEGISKGFQGLLTKKSKTQNIENQLLEKSCEKIWQFDSEKHSPRTGIPGGGCHILPKTSLKLCDLQGAHFAVGESDTRHV